MNQCRFEESAPWSLDVPKPETYVGSIFYHESGHTTEFYWEVCGGTPYAIIHPADLSILIPSYVLHRVSNGYCTEILTCESQADFPADEPNMIHIHVVPPKSKDA
jgi:hypothetical protein